MLPKDLPGTALALEPSLPLTGSEGASMADESHLDKLPTPKLVRYGASKFWTLIVAVSLLAWLANFAFTGSYLYEGWEQRVLATEIEATIQSISELPEPATAQLLLNEAELALATEHGAFSALASSPEVTQDLLALAGSVGITILEVVTEPGEVEEVGQHAFGSLLVTIQVSGPPEAFEAFLRELEEGTLPGGRINKVSIEEITSPDAGAPGGFAPEDRSEYLVPSWSTYTLTASVALSVYERQGSLD